MPPTEAAKELHAALGHKPLSKAFAKFEIILGVSSVWAGLLLLLQGSVSKGEPHELSLAGSCTLFVLGGYLAMAGSRSHIYQSNNALTAYLVSVIRQESKSEG